MSKKVMVGMSGGVDSSVAAKLLLNAGFDVTGATLKLFDSDDIIQRETRVCCSLTDVEDAKSVARKLGFQHYVFNFKNEFKEMVMDEFVNSYITGKTPNPCIQCNRYVKFDKMLLRAQELGFDYIATGHYAKIIQDNTTGRFLLIRPNDRSKDQTYVLYSLTQYQLQHTLFPLENLDKFHVRSIAEESGLINSRKPDSQDICFVPDGNYYNFIQKYTGIIPKTGKFLSTSGEELGEHCGIENFTIGQRKGLGMTFGKPMFVISKNPKDNSVTLGNEEELYSKTLIAYDINLISIEKLTTSLDVTAKIRYSQNEQAAKISPFGNKIKVEFDYPQRAVTPGQAVVFYQGDVVLGGGTVE